MGLNIKNEETCRLAGELARLTGETKTGAIALVLRERMACETKRRSVEVRLRRMGAATNRCAALVGTGLSLHRAWRTALRRARAAQVIVAQVRLVFGLPPAALFGCVFGACVVAPHAAAAVVPPPAPEKVAIVLELTPFVRSPDSAALGAGYPRARIYWLQPVPGRGERRLAFNDRRGLLYLTNDTGQRTTLYLNLREDLADFYASENPPSVTLGFFGYAFHPQFAIAGAPGFGKLYTAYTSSSNGAYASTAHMHSVVREWTASDPGAAFFAGTSREVLRVALPEPAHSVGMIAFNPTARQGSADYGLLYVGLGDAEQSIESQSLRSLHGTVLRIDPLRVGDERGYGVPPDNPFVVRPDAAPEIWAYGLRHPQQFSWDSGSHRRDPNAGRMFIADIGARAAEEVNIGSAGANYGWPVREGTYARRRGDLLPRPAADPSPLAPLTYPVALYGRGGAEKSPPSAIGGGYVYRGKLLKALTGKYLFTDFVTGRAYAIDTRDLAPERQAPIDELRLSFGGRETVFVAVAGYRYPRGTIRVDARFGIDHDGELYLLAQRDGWIYKVVDAITDRAALETHWARQLPTTPPTARGVFNVHWHAGARELVYAKIPCTPADRQARFFLHAIPAQPHPEAAAGFLNLDFDFPRWGIAMPTRPPSCVARVELPDHEVVSLRTGQFGGSRPEALWNVTIDLRAAGLVGQGG